jgi:hypothetical protein
MTTGQIKNKFKADYNLKKESERIKAIRSIGVDFLEQLRAAGIELAPNVGFEVSDWGVNLFLIDKEDKRVFASQIDIQAYRETILGIDKNQISIGGSGAFTPDSSPACYWRTIHAASILKNWEEACRIINNECRTFDALRSAIREENNWTN